MFWLIEVAIILVIIGLSFDFMGRKRKLQREDIVFFLRDCVQENPSINLEDTLNQYIKKHNLSIRHRLDEPTVVTDARTKLHIIEESDLVDPNYFQPDKQFQHYVEALRRTVNMFDSLPPEVLKRMKEKE